jgi:hypothetical protein
MAVLNMAKSHTLQRVDISDPAYTRKAIKRFHALAHSMLRLHFNFRSQAREMLWVTR